MAVKEIVKSHSRDPEPSAYSGKSAAEAHEPEYAQDEHEDEPVNARHGYCW